jgi:hypothetical protein
MVSANKAKGAKAERDTAQLLRQMGFPEADREFGAGRKDDVGDIRGVPKTVIEVKDDKSFNFSGWLLEAETERVNAKADWGIVFVKRPGKSIKEGYFLMTIENGIKLLSEALKNDRVLRQRLIELLNNEHLQ